MMREKGIRSRAIGSRFPVTLFVWDEDHIYVGDEIGRLWFSNFVGSEAYGNNVVMWTGPMDVKLENVRDQAERVNWDRGARISGPRLIHVVAEFPQIGSDLDLMYAYQAMLAGSLALAISKTGPETAVDGTDVYVEGGKLNVGVCTSTGNSCTMHFGVNLRVEGKPEIPEDVEVNCLSEILHRDDGDCFEFMYELVTRWLDRIEDLIVKGYKTV